MQGIPEFLYPIIADPKIKSIYCTLVGIELRVFGDIDLERQRDKLTSLGLEGAVAVPFESLGLIKVPGEPTPPYIMGTYGAELFFFEVRSYRPNQILSK